MSHPGGEQPGEVLQELHNLLKNRIFVLTAATVILVIVMGVSSTFSSTLNKVGNVISIPLTPIQSFFSFVGQSFEDLACFLRDTREVRLENERLRMENSGLLRENRLLRDYSKKNEELRRALELRDRFDDYHLSGANVIAKDPGNWFVVFRIDIGSRHGVKENNPVLSSDNGLIGRVLHVNFTSSKVLAIIDEDSVIDGWVTTQGGGGGSVIVRGDLRLKEDGLCKMDYIPPDVKIQQGDVVETSGLGGIYPKGIVIGKVNSVINPESNFKKYALVEPAVNFKNLEEVFVLKNRESRESDSGEN